MGEGAAVVAVFEDDADAVGSVGEDVEDAFLHERETLVAPSARISTKKGEDSRSLRSSLLHLAGTLVPPYSRCNAPS